MRSGLSMSAAVRLFRGRMSDAAALPRALPARGPTCSAGTHASPPSSRSDACRSAASGEGMPSGSMANTSGSSNLRQRGMARAKGGRHRLAHAPTCKPSAQPYPSRPNSSGDKPPRPPAPDRRSEVDGPRRDLACIRVEGAGSESSPGTAGISIRASSCSAPTSDALPPATELPEDPA